MLSIIKRRHALGLLAHCDEEERFTRTRTEIEAIVAIALGGMAAEELFFGESGTGPAADLAARDDARGADGRLVRHGGLARLLRGDRGGPDRLEEPRRQGARRPGGQGTASRRSSTEQKDRVTKLLDENRHVVVALRDALIARDELVGDEITRQIELALDARS